MTAASTSPRTHTTDGTRRAGAAPPADDEDRLPLPGPLRPWLERWPTLVDRGVRAERREATAALQSGVVLAAVAAGLSVLASRWWPGLLEGRIDGTAATEMSAAGFPSRASVAALVAAALSAVCGGAGLFVLCLVGWRLAWSRAGRAVTVAGLAAAVLGAALDLLSLLVLTVAAAADPAFLAPVSAALWAAAAPCVVIALPVAVAGASSTRRRLRRNTDEALSLRPSVATVLPPPLHSDRPARGQGAAPATGAPGAASDAADRGPARWKRAYFVPQLDLGDDDRRAVASGCRDAPERSVCEGPRAVPEHSGFCVSGGGIRSASVALGALQGLRAELLDAQFLVSVSGGGYTAGALQMALTGPPLPDAPSAPPAPAPRRWWQPGRRREQPDGGTREPVLDAPTAEQDPERVLMQGTVEEDHLRRHSSYLADGAAQWATALGVVLRCLLVSLTLVTLVVVLAGVVLGLGYSLFPLARFARGAGEAPGLRPAVGHGVFLLAAAAAALAAAVFAQRAPHDGRLTAAGRRLRVAAQGLAGLAVVLAVIGAGIPVLMQAAYRLGGPDLAPGSAAGIGAAGTLVLTYAATLVGLLWRQREGLVGHWKTVRGWSSSRLARGLVQRAVVLLALAVLLAGLALVMARVAYAVVLVVAESGLLPLPPMAWLGVLAAVALALAWTSLDQTWLGLHPFYRSRLASAFAVRPRREAAQDGALVAQPYDPEEPTTLSIYGRRREFTKVVDGVERTVRFPQVVFAAAANLSGQQRTPPGRRAVGYTFTDEWIGGPDVGYVRTRDAETATAATPVTRDLTLQSAVAISGAAVSSAMGRQSRAFQTFFALTNTRLGTWLPNPVFLAQWSRAGWDWAVPQLPSMRRLSYLLREAVGSYPCDDRLLMVTDGGHYENLGLVELLRRRPKTVYCIDASSDCPPAAGTLADAISLAYEELGVVIDIEDLWPLVPGTGELQAESELLTALKGRLSARAVLSGKIHYPSASGLPAGDPRTGTIWFAKAVLTPGMPYPVLAHAARHAVFPSDSTSDQWFDHAQFAAYTALGRALAEQVRTAQEVERSEERTQQAPAAVQDDGPPGATGSTGPAANPSAGPAAGLVPAPREPEPGPSAPAPPGAAGRRERPPWSRSVTVGGLAVLQAMAGRGALSGALRPRWPARPSPNGSVRGRT